MSIRVSEDTTNVFMLKKIIKYSVFFLLLLALLAGGVLWYGKNNEDVVLDKIFDFAEKKIATLALGEDVKNDAKTFALLARKIFVIDDVSRHYLVLLQNDMELRPGGGFLGQYATIEIKNARVVHWDVRDANHLDKEIKSDIPAPPSFARWLNVTTMKFRDSNWDLDFPTNAERAMHLYNLSDTPQDFDGVIAINGRVLEDLLRITGPITVPGYEKNGPFVAGSALIHLEDIVEKPVLLYKMKQKCKKREKRTGIEEVCGIDPETGEKIPNLSEADKVYRKKVLPLLVTEISKRLVGNATDRWRDRVRLLKENLPKILTLITNNLRTRDIQLWFKQDDMQQIVRDHNWGTIVDTAWDGDYLAVVDANLGALKSDYYIKRSLEYTVDFTGRSAEQNDASAGRMVRYRTPAIKEQVMAGRFRTRAPLATMRMRYHHTAQKANYRTSDYHAYTRLYAPEGSRWLVREWFFNPTVEHHVYGNKQATAYKFDVFIGDTLPTMLQYTLPESITEDNYKLKIQKQSGVGIIPVTVTVITSDGTTYTKHIDLASDAVFALKDTGSTKELVVTQ